MKSREQVEERARFLLQEELELRVKTSQEPLPTHCKYNFRQPLDHQKTLGGQPNPSYNRITLPVVGGPVDSTLGLCLYNCSSPTEWAGTICEDPLDAQNCPHRAFTPKYSPGQVYQQFVEDLRDGEWVIRHLPRIQPLLWVLGSMFEQSDTPFPRPGLFRRLKEALFPTRQLPPGPSAKVEIYLPPPPP